MVCVGPNGDIQGGAVYSVANTGSSFASVYKFYRSTDGGQTFTLKSSQQYANTVGTQVGGRNAVHNMRTRPYPFVACDNSYGPHRGRLYLVYASNNPTGNANKPDIFCRFSDDGGATFSAAKVVNDDVNSQSNHNWFPTVWCEKTNGRLYISWMDTRDVPTSDSCMIYGTYTDDGNTFAPNQKISNKKFKINCNSCGGGGTPMYLGDYNGIASNPVTAMASWTDFRDNNFGSYVAYFPDYAVKAEPAIDTLSPVAIINVKVPSVKLYSDTVFVSATMSGSPGLFTISYPEGNKLWSYPGFVPVQITGNGSVPIGDYTLNIVTTGSNGTPIHKRTATVRALTPVAPTAGFSVNDTAACEGQGINFQDFSAGPPTSWAWSFPGGNPSTSTAQNPSNIVYNTAGEYDVTLTVTNQAGSNSITKTAYITVSTVPANPTANNEVICLGETVPNLTATGENLRWYNGSLYVGSGSSYATGKTLPGVYNYNVTQSITGCESAPTLVSLTINALPVVTFSMSDSVCGNDPAFDLTGGLPAGGLYAGPGVAANGIAFEPIVAGAGVHTLTYTYSDANSCVNSASHIITIAALPAVSLDPIAPVCVSAPAVTLNGTPAGGTFQGQGVSGNVFDPAISGAGEFSISYSFTDSITKCLVSTSQLVKVNALPFIATHDTSSCGNRPVVFDASIPNTVSYLWTPGGSTSPTIEVDTVGRGLGQFNYTITVTDANNCVSSKDVKVTFFDCTGLQEPNGIQSIELFPNPNNGRFSIQSNNLPSGTYKLKIINSSNITVYQENNVNVTEGFKKALDLKKLSNGMYLLRLENQHTGWSRQFIISR